uniref:Zinc finger, CCHC domain containing 9 n=1 Tax=Oryzias sinensis TaxID=183150 RepID=A0A8C7ZS73_9TELE
MTRWARANNVHRHKPAEATPWSQLRGRGSGGGAQGAPLRRTQASGSSAKNRKKKDYTNEDVNGFLQYLKESGAPLPAGGQQRQKGEQELVQEVGEALRKDQRRETRRVKRQTDKKNKMLCFNCRKPGHGLADCPEADADREMGRGICYRCGSTEHEIHKCRAKVDPALGDYPYAKCFICGQTGHLSRSCPDNPKGLYAEGGSCRLCGSVEHFQKDCPEHQAWNSRQSSVEVKKKQQSRKNVV